MHVSVQSIFNKINGFFLQKKSTKICRPWGFARASMWKNSLFIHNGAKSFIKLLLNPFTISISIIST